MTGFGPSGRSSRISLLFLAAIGTGSLTIVPAKASAQTADLSNCLGIVDINQRVQCYDAIARAQAEASAPVQAPGASAPSAEPVEPLPPPQPVVAEAGVAAREANRASIPPEQSEEADFGFNAAQREARRAPDEREAGEIAYRVSAIRRIGPGYLQYEMADGSIWRTEEIRRSFRPSRIGDSVFIRRGALGAFYLDADRQTVIRIRRLS